MKKRVGFGQHRDDEGLGFRYTGRENVTPARLYVLNELLLLNLKIRFVYIYKPTTPNNFNTRKNGVQVKYC